MSDNKLKEIKDKVVGSAKEVVGKVTDNEKLEVEGKLQKGVGKAREVVNDVSDEAKPLTDKLVGGAKEIVGKVTDNEKLEAEGKLQQGLGKARKVVNDAADDVSDAAKAAKDKLVGGAKEVVGKVIGNDDLEFEGKIQKAQGKAREFANDDDAASKIKKGK